MTSIIRKAVKTIAAHFVCIIEFCHDCGVRQPIVWTASDPLWFEVTKKASKRTDGGGVLCPSCFSKRATAAGLMLRWVPLVEYRGNKRIETTEVYERILGLEAK